MTTAKFCGGRVNIVIDGENVGPQYGDIVMTTIYEKIVPERCVDRRVIFGDFSKISDSGYLARKYIFETCHVPSCSQATDMYMSYEIGSMQLANGDMLILVTGDGDFASIVHALRCKGVQVHVIGLHVSEALKQSATSWHEIERSADSEDEENDDVRFYIIERLVKETKLHCGQLKNDLRKQFPNAFLGHSGGFNQFLKDLGPFDIHLDNGICPYVVFDENDENVRSFVLQRLVSAKGPINCGQLKSDLLQTMKDPFLGDRGSFNKFLKDLGFKVENIRGCPHVVACRAPRIDRSVPGIIRTDFWGMREIAKAPESAKSPVRSADDDARSISSEDLVRSPKNNETVFCPVFKDKTAETSPSPSVTSATSVETSVEGEEQFRGNIFDNWRERFGARRSPTFKDAKEADTLPRISEIWRHSPLVNPNDVSDAAEGLRDLARNLMNRDYVDVSTYVREKIEKKGPLEVEALQRELQDRFEEVLRDDDDASPFVIEDGYVRLKSCPPPLRAPPGFDVDSL